MKLFIIGSLLFSGGTAVAMQDENIRENVTDMYKNVRERVQKRVKENLYENLKENGFPYPSEERLESLTEEQQTAIISAIDQINATYDFSSMTDDEIREAMLTIQEDFDLLGDELGIDVPQNWMQNRFRRRVQQRTHEVIRDNLLENIRETGIEYPNEDRLSNLTEEQSSALIAKIDEFNETYDWVNMTDEEILEAMITVREELMLLHEELNFPFPQRDENCRDEILPEDSQVDESAETV